MRLSTLVRHQTSLLVLFVFLAVLIVYLATLSHDYSPDSMAFALMVTRNQVKEPLFFQAEHLLYPAVGWAWYKVWQTFGYNEGALKPLQMLNALSGAIGAALFFLSLRLLLDKTRNGIIISLVIAFALAFSYSYWYHSTGAEDQIISNVLAIVSFLILVVMVRQVKSTSYLAIMLGVTSGLAILLHATHVLFLPALLFGLWLVRHNWRDILRWAMPFVLLVAVSYLLVGSLAHQFHSMPEYRDWALSAPSKGVWGQLEPQNLWQGVKTLATSVIYLQGGPNVRALIGGTLDWRNILDVAAFAVTIAGATGAVVYALRYRRQLAYPSLIPLCILWLAAHVLFALYWAPEDVQFWSTVLPPLALISAMALLHFGARFSLPRGTFPGLCLLGVLGLLGFNTASAMLPRADLATNEDYAKAMCLRDYTEHADLIITPGWDWASSYLPYFGQREVLSIVDSYLLSAERDKAKLLQLIEERVRQTQAQGGKVCIVRLYDLDDNDRAWLLRTTGLSPEDFAFKRRQVCECLDEPVWEILP